MNSPEGLDFGLRSPGRLIFSGLAQVSKKYRFLCYTLLDRTQVRRSQRQSHNHSTTLNSKSFVPCTKVLITISQKLRTHFTRSTSAAAAWLDEGSTYKFTPEEGFAQYRRQLFNRAAIMRFFTTDAADRVCCRDVSIFTFSQQTNSCFRKNLNGRSTVSIFF